MVSPPAPRAPARAAALRAVRPVGAGWRAPRENSLRQQLGRDRPGGNLVPEVFLDLRQRDRVLLAGKTDGITLGAGACGAPDAVNVVGRILRQIEIEHVAHVRD